METVRKILIVLFATASIVFAAIAVKRHTETGLDSIIDQHSMKYTWTRSLEKSSRALDKPVFFKIPELKATLPAEVQNALENAYICMELNPELNPADYKILNSILCRFLAPYRRTTEDCPAKILAAGILSPRLTPIFLTKCGSEKPAEIANAIMGTLAVYREIAPKILENARKTSYALEREQGFSLSLGNDDTALCVKFFADGKFAENPCAMVTENARLFFSLPAPEFESPAYSAAMLAAKNYLEGKIRKGESPTETILSATALIDAKDPSRTGIIRAAAKKTANCVSADGVLRAPLNPFDSPSYNPRPSVHENALAATFLAKAYTLTDDKTILAAAERLASTLAKALAENGEMPAVLSCAEKSQADSYDYSYTFEAFATLFKATKDKKYFELAKNTFDEWTRFYAAPPRGWFPHNENALPKRLWSVNSENSVTAAFVRPVWLDDGVLPSYVGRAASAAAFLSGTQFAVPRILRETAQSHASPLAEINSGGYKRASLKLAAYKFAALERKGAHSEK